MRIAVWIALWALVGCRAASREPVLPPGHPANPAAAAAAPAERAATLDLSHAVPVGESAATPGAVHRDHDAHHPSATESDDPGDAPEGRPATPAPSGVIYVCPMHPEVTSDEPGQRCPKCGMALVRREGGVNP